MTWLCTALGTIGGFTLNSILETLPMSSTPSIRARVLVLAMASLALVPAATVHAQSTAAAPAAPAPNAPPPDHMRGPHAMHAQGPLRDLTRLKTSLRLDARQTALWDQAVGRMQPPANLREQMKVRREHVTAMLDDPAFDPRKLAAEMDADEAERTAMMKGTRDAWIAVYESLDPVQRGQVREFLRGRMMHGPGMRGPMHGHHPMGEAGPELPPRG